jgi:hypothetical protein
VTKLREKMAKVFSKETLDMLCTIIDERLRRDGKEYPVSMERVGNQGGLEYQILRLINYLKQPGYLHYLVNAVLERYPDRITLDDIQL